jgi:hypothetical protein
MATFTVPNEASASYTDQAELDAMDIQVIVAGFAGTGVISGCLVTAQGSPDGTVAVSSGSIRVAGSTVSVTGANVSVMTGSANADGSTNSAANATYYRYDLIVANASGQLGVLHGTVPAPAWPDYSVNPTFPTVTKANCVLAAVLIPPTAASITGIASSQIVAKNVEFSVNAPHDQAHLITSTTNHSSGWGGKGYILTATSSTVGTTIAPGTNGQVLTANSAQSAGLEWTTPTSSTAFITTAKWGI